MISKISLITVLFMLTACIHAIQADVIITFEGDELRGKIVSITDKNVSYVPLNAPADSLATLPKQSVFMVRYDDGRKVVFSTKPVDTKAMEESAGRDYSAYVFLEQGLFGLVNINEKDYDPGVYTYGVTPSIDRRLNQFLSIGIEYMIIWVKAHKAQDARFLMNCNLLGRLRFPLGSKFGFLAQINSGVSIWPGAESIHNSDTTFFKDRIGWDIHGGLGLDYKVTKEWSIVCYAGYNANFSTLHEIPVTIDMLILSIGPKFQF